MSKDVARIVKSTKILQGAKVALWCYVNVDNEFSFMNEIMVIDESVEDYKVDNKYSEVEDYTNRAYMEEILVVMDVDNHLRFYNQNYDEIDHTLVRVKG